MQLVRPQQLPGPARLQVLLAHVDAVGPHLGGDLHIVVDDADGALFPAQGHEPLRLRQEVRLAQVLFPQLDDARPAVDGRRHLAEQALRVMGPGPVRHGIQPQLSGFHLHTSRPPLDTKTADHQIRSSAAESLMISLRWHDPNQVKGQNLAGFLSARASGLPRFRLVSIIRLFAPDCKQNRIPPQIFVTYLTNHQHPVYHKAENDRGAGYG